MARKPVTEGAPAPARKQRRKGRRRTTKRVVGKSPLLAAPHVSDQPLVIPAPVPTYVLYVVEHPTAGIIVLKHVCTHFERFPDRIVPRCMIPADETVIEAACLHPTGEVSGSPKASLTFANFDQYRSSLLARYERKTEPPVVEAAIIEEAGAVDPLDQKPTTRNSEAFKRARAMFTGDDEDLVG